MSRVNTDLEQRIKNIQENCKRGLPEIVSLPPNRKQMIVVGGGTSLKNQLPRIRHRAAKKSEIWATNGTHDYLISKGIIPHCMAMLDSRDESAQFVKNPHKGVSYFIASQCHPSVFDALEGHKVYIWHVHSPELQDTIMKASASIEPLMILGGSTVGLRSMCLGAALGYRSIHHYGMDSSYDDTAHHAYEQSLNDGEEIKVIECMGKKFICSAWMLDQAEDYENQLEALEKAGVRVFAHGTGLIPFIHHMHIGENYASTS
jgi:hypothetical protein